MRLHTYLVTTLLAVLAATHSSHAQTVGAGAKSVSLVPCKDPWASARDRFWDIADNQYNGFINAIGTANEFKYSNAGVTLSYDPAPSVPYFVGRIQATGLKPNFAYQLKLTGKPSRGRRGWGSYGDDWSNDKIGYAGRWWCDSSHASQTNFDDSHYEAYYDNATPGTEHDIYGYQFMGSFITDRFGNANVNFTGQSSYHVDWKDSQLSASQKSNTTAFVVNPASPFAVGSTSPYYGYGAAIPSSSVKLWYEYETGRARNNVQLPVGRYNCRFLITEESFHNTSFYGGYWKTVLASEDFATDAFGSYLTDPSGNLVPDSSAGNDIVFTIGLPTAPANLTATAGDSRVNLQWTAATNATTYTLQRAEVSGGPYTTLASNIAATSYADTAVENGKTYYYIVIASGNAGESTPSNEASATPQHIPLAAPQNLTAAAVSEQIELDWSAVDGATSYSVKRSEIGGGPYDTLADNVTAIEYSDTTASPGVTYFYVVTAHKGDEESAPSNEATATRSFGTVATPTITPNGGTFAAPVTVSLSTSTPDATIRYTTNGTEPTGTSPTYTAPFTVSASTTVKARAFKIGWDASAIATAAFNISSDTLFAPTADAYVRDGTYKKLNYGSASSLRVQTASSSGNNSDAYFKFDLSSATNVANIKTIKLRFSGALSGSGTLQTSVYSSGSSTWLENTLTWANKPNLRSVLGSASISSTTANWYEVDVTSYVKSELGAGRRTISVALHNRTKTTISLAVNSRESATSPPRLVVTY